MVDQEQEVVTKESNQVNQRGDVVNKKTQALRTSTSPKTVATNLIGYLYGIISIILALRFALKLFAANPNNAFVDFVYRVSGVLSAPFDTIFGVTKTTAGSTISVFEPSILVAIAVYGLIAWGVIKLLTVNEPRANSI